VRREPLPRFQNDVPSFDLITDDVVALKPVPKDFLDKMKDARSLTWFECDWWSWSIPDLKVVLESCPNLEVRCALKLHIVCFSESLREIEVKTMLGCSRFETVEPDVCFCLFIEFADSFHMRQSFACSRKSTHPCSCASVTAVFSTYA